MRRPVALVVAAAALVAAGLLLAGCGSEGVVTATPQTVEGNVPKPTVTTPTTPALPPGHPGAGEAIFTSAGCVGCHTLKAANSHGTVGPVLDDTKPDLARIIDRLSNGKGGMPAFLIPKGSLSAQQVADVAAFVFQSTH